jgi:hypothetical protein
MKVARRELFIDAPDEDWSSPADDPTCFDPTRNDRMYSPLT